MRIREMFVVVALLATAAVAITCAQDQALQSEDVLYNPAERMVIFSCETSCGPPNFGNDRRDTCALDSPSAERAVGGRICGGGTPQSNILCQTTRQPCAADPGPPSPSW